MIIELGISCIPTPTIATWAMPQPPNPNINYALHISKGVNRAQCKWVWDILSTRCLPLVVFSQGHIATAISKGFLDFYSSTDFIINAGSKIFLGENV